MKETFWKIYLYWSLPLSAILLGVIIYTVFYTVEPNRVIVGIAIGLSLIVVILTAISICISRPRKLR
jgi:hypothetical protein